VENKKISQRTYVNERTIINCKSESEII